MISKKKYILSITTLSIIIILQAIVITKPFTKNVVSSRENAIIIAKAELIRRYGEAVIDGVEFEAYRFIEIPNYWYVFILPPQFSSQPHVLVRESDGKVKMRWTDSQIFFHGAVNSWFG